MPRCLNIKTCYLLYEQINLVICRQMMKIRLAILLIDVTVLLPHFSRTHTRVHARIWVLFRVRDVVGFDLGVELGLTL